jgi:hypothetical protein
MINRAGVHCGARKHGGWGDQEPTGKESERGPAQGFGRQQPLKSPKGNSRRSRSHASLAGIGVAHDFQ